MTKANYLEMSDEDFLNASTPTSTATTETETETTSTDTTGETTEQTVTETTVETPAEPPIEKTETEETLDAVDSNPLAQPDDAVVKPAAPAAPGSADPSGSDAGSGDKKPEDAETGTVPAGEPKVEGEKAEKTEPKEETKSVDYEAFFRQVMTPFKANGKMIELKTPEEAIRLMQMGAGYGRKLQDMQPHLKTLRMLEKNNLLDENELSFLIDIRNKNPDAIKKLIKDSGIDPLDLNPEDNKEYTPTNHSVSDAEMRFQEALSELQAQPTGTETLQVINQTWDQESKGLLWDKPELLGVIQSQRETGIYDQIVAEIDRQKLLGQIPQHTPFLHAYKIAGDFIQANGGFKLPESALQETTTTTPSVQTQAPVQSQVQPTVIATRPAAPKPQVQNSDKARAASPTQSTSRKASTFVNPLEMADDEFLKTFANRL